MQGGRHVIAPAQASIDISHLFPTLDAEQLAATRDKGALWLQQDAATDAEWSAAWATDAAAVAAVLQLPRSGSNAIYEVCFGISSRQPRR